MTGINTNVNQSTGCGTCPFKTTIDPHSCSMVHRDVEETRKDLKDLVAAVNRIDKTLAVNSLKITVSTSIITSVLFATLNYFLKVA